MLISSSSIIGKVLLIILVALSSDPLNTVEVLSVEDGDTLNVFEAS
ncbi:hypothetical protein PMIT1327_00812 [Prochlorococcus marinus str. MIT 1327]|nr:hypothetical protein PMIT1312_00413 [Prochlorococcus marinus str. MIT 1312]KZR82549.1 hypothetical protein PMIT1327_00812 [Prochlorococcus marinus str. MIT 1327]